MKWLTKIGHIALGVFVAWMFVILAITMFWITRVLVEAFPTAWKEFYT